MKRNLLSILGSLAILAIVAILFFSPDVLSGRQLQQHDILQGLANTHEVKEYLADTGRTSRWTNALFGGMPTFQISPNYTSTSLLGWLTSAFMLWLPQPAGLLFAMMAGFFILCLCMKVKWPQALFGAIAWGFSSYFIIIIGAGHIWKFLTLAFIPPTIGGIVLLYRRKYLAGSALTALFATLQLQSNHPQMTYYFLFVVLAFMVAYLVRDIRGHQMKGWWAATGCMVGCAVIAVAANSASLYNSYEYARETVRGSATALSSGAADDTGGMNRQAITAWSYGLDESFTLLIPDVKGGATIKPTGNDNRLLSLADTPKADELSLSPEERQFLSQFPQYFGDQPMTNGPVYVGAFLLLFAILALFIVKTPLKWALFAVSVLALFLSWGHNFPAFTDFFIDNFPGYNKFRAVASILVIPEFTIPLLAVLCLREIITHREETAANIWTFYAVFGLGAVICFLGWVAPSIFGQPFSQSELEALSQAGAFSNPAYYNVVDAIRQTRLSLVSADSLRSLIMILLAGGWTWLWLRGKLRSELLFTGALTLLLLIDLFSVCKRYVDSENFSDPAPDETVLSMTPADEAILRDTSYYRVMDVAGMGSARSSYFHKTIGGYHAAKLTRYNDLLEHQISRGNMGVINMLNTKYIMSGNEYQENPDALGPVWFVDKLLYVDGADSEMAALDSLDTGHIAVADSSFQKILGNAGNPTPGDTIFLISYAPDRLSYRSSAKGPRTAIFSEVYFPWGWEATVDGTPVEIGRADYTLRALTLPAGNHEIVFSFDPRSLKVTNALGVAAAVLLYLLCAVALCAWLVPLYKKRKGGEKVERKEETDR